MQPASVHHLAILVSDLDRAEQFYTQVLGLELLRRWPDSSGTGTRSVWVSTGPGTFLALERAVAPLEGDEVTETKRPGYHLLALQISKEDRAAWRERLDQAGHPVTQETAFTLYFRDPEGNRLGLSHWPEAADETQRSPQFIAG